MYSNKRKLYLHVLNLWVGKVVLLITHFIELFINNKSYMYSSQVVIVYSVTVELKEMKLQDKKLKEKCKHEDGIVSAVSLWTNDLLPNWETM